MAISVAEIATPRFLGGLLSNGLYGILLVQVWIYWSAFPDDKRGIKAFVYTLLGIETLQTIVLFCDAIRTYGVFYGNLKILDEEILSWFAVPFLSSIVSTSVQLFFAWRIRTLSRTYIIPTIVVMLSLLQGGALMAQAIRGHIIGHYSKIGAETKVTFALWLTTACTCDILISAAMAYYLSAKRNGIKRTDDLLTRLIRLSIETGAITALMAIIDAIMGLAFPTKAYFLPPSHVLAKLYSNNFLMILNNRLRIKDGRSSKEDQAKLALTGSAWGDLSTLCDVGSGKMSKASESISMSRLEDGKDTGRIISMRSGDNGTDIYPI